MTRMLLPLSVADISSFAKNLTTHLDERHAQGQPAPSHVELLNLLARCAGLRNFQALRASTTGRDVPARDLPPPPPQAADVSPALPVFSEQAEPPVDYSTLTATVRKALMQFDTAGRLVRLPTTPLVTRRRCGANGST